MISARPFWGKSLRWLLMRPSSDAVVEGDCTMLSGRASNGPPERIRGNLLSDTRCGFAHIHAVSAT